MTCNRLIVLQSQLYTCDQPFLSPYPSIYSHLSLPKSPKSIPFPAFGFSPKYPIGSLTQSMCPVTLDSGLSQPEVFSSIASY